MAMGYGCNAAGVVAARIIESPRERLVAILTNNARLDASKVGAQIYAQLVSSSYGMINASASISGSASNSVSYSYGGDVSGEVSPKTVV